MTSIPEYSIWLMPPPAEQERFASLIAHLSERLGTARFEPHITLAGCRGGETEAIARAQEVARRLAPLPVRLERLDTTDRYFRCLYMRAEISPALIAAHRLAAEHGGVDADPDFLPHLSLVYGTLAMETKQSLIDEIGRQCEASFIATHLCLCRPDGDPAAWRLYEPMVLGQT